MINTERILNASKNMVIATSYTTSLTKLKTVAIAIVAAAGAVILIYGGVKFAESFQKKDQKREYNRYRPCSGIRHRDSRDSIC